MRKPLPMPPEIEQAIKKHLGTKAIAIQQSGLPLGLWLVWETGKEDARYVPVNVFLRDMLTAAPEDEKQWFLDEIEAMDETKEIFVLFVLSETEQFASRVTIIEDEGD
jgi:hypothetical protein